MKAIVLGLLLAAGVAEQKCCDPRHELLETNVNRIIECRGVGGAPVTVIIEDKGGHPFPQLARCDFPIPLQREHLLPQVERQAEKDKEL